MENQQFSAHPGACDSAWSNRILTLAIAGILFLTLYPFRFDFHSLGGIASPFLLLGKGLKTSGFFDAFLNVLLFTPFGFGLAAKLRERGRSQRFTFVAVLLAGALFSYGIEFLQNYIPERDSGWEDVLTNSSGSVVGFLLFEVFGSASLPILSACERGLGAFLSRWRAIVVLLLYFGLWFTASIWLQRKTGLRSWVPDALLVIGNDASGKNAWTGKIRLVQIWDRAISNEVIKSVFAAEGANAKVHGLLASYDFSTSTPMHDQQSFLSDLIWMPRNPSNLATSPLVLDGSFWLSSKVSAQDLVQDLQKSNQFAVRVVCIPGRTNGVDARVLSISQPSGLADLTMRQEGTALVFWFRTGISVKKALLAWHIPDVFRVAEARDILYSYDGSNLSLYIDGKLQSTRYKLGPGAVLATRLRMIRPSELSGYDYIYYSLVFFPGGALLGIAARRLPTNRLAGYVALGLMTLIIPLLLEFVLISVSGRSFSAANVLLSIGLIVGAGLWINADHKSLQSAR